MLSRGTVVPTAGGALVVAGAVAAHVPIGVVTALSVATATLRTQFHPTSSTVSDVMSFCDMVGNRNSVLNVAVAAAPSTPSATWLPVRQTPATKDTPGDCKLTERIVPWSATNSFAKFRAKHIDRTSVEKARVVVAVSGGTDPSETQEAKVPNTMVSAVARSVGNR